MALGVLSAATLMVVLDGSIVAVALPAIQSDLGFTQSSLAWVVNSYMIAFAGLLLLSGRLGDLLGRTKIFLAGLAVFTIASILAGVAWNPAMLIATRFAQGVGGAMASAVALGMVVTLFPEPRERVKALGVYSFTQASGASIGLILGGVLTQATSWNWIFFINIPIGVAAAVMAIKVLPRDQGVRGRADALGALLVTSGLMLGVYAIVQSQPLPGIAAVVLLIGFVVRQATGANPLLPLRIFASRQVSGANVVVVLLVAGMFGFQFMSALYLHRVLGLNAVQTGIAFLPAPILIATLSLGFAARLNSRFGPKNVLIAGLALLVVGLLLLSRAPADGQYLTDVLPAFVLLGIGFGAAMPALMGLAMSGATESDSGVASGLMNTTQQAGGAVGLAVLATLATARSDDLMSNGVDTATALTEGYSLAFLLGAVFVAVAIMVAIVVLRNAQHHEPAIERAEPAARGQG